MSPQVAGKDDLGATHPWVVQLAEISLIRAITNPLISPKSELWNPQLAPSVCSNCFSTSTFAASGRETAKGSVEKRQTRKEGGNVCGSPEASEYGQNAADIAGCSGFQPFQPPEMVGWLPKKCGLG